MAAASPIPALADRVSAVRDAVAVRCSELHGVETPAARSELMKLREALRLLTLGEDRLRACGPAVTDRLRPFVCDEDGRDARCGGDPHPARMPINTGNP